MAALAGLQWSHVFSDMVRKLTKKTTRKQTQLQWSHVFSDMVRLEGLGQDMCGYLEDIPGVGGVYEGAKRRGLGIPAIVGTIVLVILIVAFLRSKKGKKMIAGAKKKVGGAKKKVTG